MGRMPVRPRAKTPSPRTDAGPGGHPVLSGVSTGYPGGAGWLHTRYAPVRHSRAPEGALTVRLACIRPAASVHPEPGSNSSLYYCSCFFLFRISDPPSRDPPPGGRCPSRPASRPDFCSVLASSCQRAAQRDPLSQDPRFLPVAGCKSTTNFVTGNENYHFFLKTLNILLMFNVLKFKKSE